MIIVKFIRQKVFFVIKIVSNPSSLKNQKDVYSNHKMGQYQPNKQTVKFEEAGKQNKESPNGITDISSRDTKINNPRYKSHLKQDIHIPTTEYDFEKANAGFQKFQISEKEPTIPENKGYDKQSFFDNISTDSKDRLEP